ncbi:uncharacterized protein AB9W97_004090 isoform 2-T3 [Spinachia spinachia]
MFRATSTILKGVKPGLVNDIVILSARPKERKLTKGISCHFRVTGWDPLTCSFVHTEHQQHHMMSLATTLETAHKIANSTKEQSSYIKWHQLRRPRIPSSKFRDVCQTREQSSAENLAKRLLRLSHQTADMRWVLDMKPAALEEYCRVRSRRRSPRGRPA